MAATIQDIHRQFDPLQPLEADDPRYVDCTRERGLPALFQRLSLPLGDPPRPFLFSGHMGDGKTTLLKQLQGQLAQEEGDFVAFGQADLRLDLSDVEYDDVLLAILAVVDQSLRERFQERMDGNAFQRIWQAISRITHLSIQPNIPLGPLGELSLTLRDSADTRIQVRQRLRSARGPTFLEVVNDYLRQAQDVVRQHQYRQLIVILDDLDRLSDIHGTGHVFPDERLFIGHATPLLGVQCHVVYTVRLALARAQEAALTVRYGQEPLVVPMIPVRWPDGAPHAAGMAKLREVVQRRIQAAGTTMEQAFSDQAQIDRLCLASGGHLRTLMILIRSTCAEALAAHPALPLTAEDVRAAIRNMSAQRRHSMAGYASILQQVGATHRLDELPAEVRYTVLHRLLVHEYFSGDDYWYDVSPLLQTEETNDGA